MSLLGLFFIFMKIGTFNYGGGLAMLSLIENEIVTLNNLLTPAQFVDIVTISQMTPGPIAINAATFTGYLVLGVPGSLVATFGLIIIPFILIVCLSDFFSKVKDKPTTKSIFKGMRPIVVGLILNAVFVVGNGNISSPFSIFIIFAVLVANMKYKISPIICILASGVFSVIVHSLNIFPIS